MPRKSIRAKMAEFFRPHTGDSSPRGKSAPAPLKLVTPGAAPLPVEPPVSIRTAVDETRYRADLARPPKLEPEHVSSPDAHMQIEPTRFTMPAWIDQTEWDKMTAQQRWNGSQALLAMMGHEGWGAGMAALRGIPNQPPAWIKKTAKPDMQTALRLERHCAFVAARGVKDELRRAEENKLCIHRWAATAANSARVCEKCGFVDDLTKGAS